MSDWLATSTPAIESNWLEDDESSPAIAEAPLDAALVARLLSKVKPGVEPKRCVRERLGVELAKRLDVHCSLEEIGAHFGVTNKNAYQLSALALGTFACHLYLRMVDRQ